MGSPQASSNTSSAASELDSTTTQTGDDLIYYTDKDVDPTLQQIVDLLNIDPFDLSSLAVKRVLPNRKFDNLFSFSPCELPISSRVQRECGPGLYEIWITHDKRIYKRLKLNISQAVGPSGAITQTTGDHVPVDSNVTTHKRRSRNRGRSNHGTHNKQQNPAQPIIDAIGLLKDLGVLTPQQPPAAVPEQSFDALLADRIATSKALGFERPEGGSAQLNEPSFFDSDFAGEALSKLYSMAQSGIGLWQLSVLTRQDEVRVASGLDPIHLRGTGDPPPPPEATSTADEPNPSSVDEPTPETSEGPTMSPGKTDGSDRQQLEVHMHYLVAMAEAETGTDHWASCTLDIFDEDFLQATILSPGALDAVLHTRPDLEKYRPWFAGLISDMQRQIKEMDEDEDEDAAAKRSEDIPAHKLAAGEANEKDVREESTPEKKRAGNRPGSGNTG